MSFTEEEKQVLREEYLYDVDKDASVWLPVEYLKAIAQREIRARSLMARIARGELTYVKRLTTQRPEVSE